MGLSSSLQIARSGLIAHQTGIEVTGNNLANVATPGYHRQRVNLAPIRPTENSQGLLIGNGVKVDSITRQVNEALEGRLRAANADAGASGAERDLLLRIEAVQNELSDVDLSSQLTAYFDAWSQLSTNPQDLSLRTLVTEQAGSLTAFIQDLRGKYDDLTVESGAGLAGSVKAADDLLGRIASLNGDIRGREGLGGEAASLRDQRDQLLLDLSQHLDISTVERAAGVVDVFVGSLPIVLNGESRGIELRQRSVDGIEVTELAVKADGSRLGPGSGELGARLGFGEGPLREAIAELDTLAGALIFNTNDLYAQGQGLTLRREYEAGVRRGGYDRGSGRRGADGPAVRAAQRLVPGAPHLRRDRSAHEHTHRDQPRRHGRGDEPRRSDRSPLGRRRDHRDGRARRAIAGRGRRGRTGESRSRTIRRACWRRWASTAFSRATARRTSR